MGLLAQMGIKAADISITEAEKKLDMGGLVPEGVHHAVLDAVGAIPKNEDRGWKLTFKIVAGAADGATIEDTLWKPKGDDPKKDQTTINRFSLFAHRLGLLKKVMVNGKEQSEEVEGKSDFTDAIGTPCFIHVKHREDSYEEKDKKTGEKTSVIKKIMRAELEFKGLLSPDDKLVKGVPVASGTTVAGAAAASKAASPAEQKAKFNVL